MDEKRYTYIFYFGITKDELKKYLLKIILFIFSNGK